jgi:hypothetical protein
MKARVMRFDGAAMWLCDDPSSPDAPSDPAVRLLSRIGDALEAKA